MNNDLKYTLELTLIDISYLKVACSLAKELCGNVTDWDLLRDKLDTQFEQSFNQIFHIE